MGLFMPKLCCACNNTLVQNESYLCTNCLLQLPQTRFQSYNDNPVARLFWGRVPLKYVFSFLYFRKDSITQHLLHQIKYNDHKNLAEHMGWMMGEYVEKMPEKPDLIAAIPLHKHKERRRGYNQSALIADGISRRCGAPNTSTNLQRTKYTESQTRKNRYQRWENVDEIFCVKDEALYAGKHVLLIDDVITTGSTIEACVQCLLDVEGCKVSVASLAIAAN
jgi:ComF family protein